MWFATSYASMREFHVSSGPARETRPYGSCDSSVHARNTVAVQLFSQTELQDPGSTGGSGVGVSQVLPLQVWPAPQHDVVPHCVPLLQPHELPRHVSSPRQLLPQLPQFELLLSEMQELPPQ